MNMHRFALSMITLLLLSTYVHASSVVKVEVKELNGQTLFIFYHDRFVQLRTNFNTNLGTVTANQPIKLEFIGATNLQKLAGSFSLSKDGMGFSFPTKAKYVMDGRVDGEKLTAIKLKVISEKPTTPDVKDTTTQIEETYPEPKITESDLKRKDAIDVRITKKNDGVNLLFPIKGKPRFAVWKRGKYIWLAIDTYFEFTAKQTDFVKEFRQIDHNSTLIRITAPRFSYANASLSPGSINLNLTTTQAKGTKQLPFDITSDVITFKNHFENASVIAFQDPDIGDEMRAVVTSDPGTFVANSRSMLDFQILPSFHGLCILLSSDDVSIDFGKNNAIITSHYEVPDIATQATQITTQSQSKNDSMLPIITNDLMIKNFQSIQSHLWQSIAASTGSSYTSKLDLSQFYFMHGLYHESLAMLDNARQVNPQDFKNNTSALLQNAVTLSILGKYKNAKELYDQLATQYNGVLPSEISMFRNYNEYMMGNIPVTIGFINSLNQFINLYPEDLYWPLAFSEIDLCLQNNNLRTLESLFKSLRTPNKAQIADNLKLYKATYYRKKNQINIAKQLLSELVDQDADPYNSTRAEIELIKLLRDTDEINTKNAIQKLDKLRFKWRGDKVEFDLLMTLAEYYKDDNDPIHALRTYKYMVTAFGQQFQHFYITSEMSKIYNSIFLPHGLAEKMSDFNAVALFYEFHDETPIGVDGDNVILMIAQRLINLDLLDKAAQLLQHQVKYRLSGEKQAASADHLALVLIMMNKPQEAINALNDTDDSAKTLKEHIYRGQLKAKAFIDMGKYDEALAHLSDEGNDQISSTMRKEIYFKSKHWHDYINYVKPELVKALKSTITGDRTQDVLRLAISYSMLNKTADLKALYTELKTDNKQLQEVVKFLLATNQPVDYRNLDKSLNIDPMKGFLNDSRTKLLQQDNLSQ